MVIRKDKTIHVSTVWHPRHSLRTIDEHTKILTFSDTVPWFVLCDPGTDFKDPLPPECIDAINKQAQQRETLLFIRCLDDYHPDFLYAGRIVNVQAVSRDSINFNALDVPEYYKKLPPELEVRYCIRLSDIHAVEHKRLLDFTPYSDFVSAKYSRPFPLILFEKRSNSQGSYVFRDNGGVWIFYIEGMNRSITVPHMKGFIYHAHALVRPGKACGFAELSQLTEKRPYKMGLANDLSTADNDEESNDVFDDIFPECQAAEDNFSIADQSFGGYNTFRKTRGLETGIVKAIKDGDVEKARKLMEIHAAIENGSSSLMGPALKKEINRIKKCMREAREAIKINLRKAGEPLILYDHLERCLPIKFPLRYNPEKVLPWDIKEE